MGSLSRRLTFYPHILPDRTYVDHQRYRLQSSGWTNCSSSTSLPSFRVFLSALPFVLPHLEIRTEFDALDWLKKWKILITPGSNHIDCVTRIKKISLITLEWEICVRPKGYECPLHEPLAIFYLWTQKLFIFLVHLVIDQYSQPARNC